MFPLCFVLHMHVSTSQECLSSTWDHGFTSHCQSLRLCLVSIHIHSTFPHHIHLRSSLSNLLTCTILPNPFPLRRKSSKWHTRNFQKLQTISRLHEHPESRAEFNWNIFFTNMQPANHGFTHTFTQSTLLWAYYPFNVVIVSVMHFIWITSPAFSNVNTYI